MIAITGANGLLGSFILKKFIAEKEPVIALKRPTSNLSATGLPDNVVWRDADINNSVALRDALEKVDTVIHAAAIVSFDPRAKNKIFETNVVGTRNIVNACLGQGIRRLIFISSVAALGRKKGMEEINEDTRWTDSDLNSDYAKSKYLAELEVYRGQEEGLSISIVNPSVILSTTDPNKSSAQIFKYVQQQRLFYTDGSINYVDVRDVAESVFRIYQTPAPGEKFIVSAGCTEVRPLISKIARRLGKKPPSIKINPRLLPLAGWLEEMRCKLTGAEALISRQSVKMQQEKFTYQNQKSVERLNMTYRSLDETLDWCCDHYKRAFTTNK